MRHDRKLLTPLLALLLLAVGSCASLRVPEPAPDRQSLLILPVQFDNRSQNPGDGFYYVYEIVSDDDRVEPYNAVMKMRLPGDLLVIDSLPPGDYRVNRFIYLTEGSGDFTYGDNVQERNDRFRLQPGKITLFHQSLNIEVYHSIPGRGMTTSYRFNMEPVTQRQKAAILAQLQALPNIGRWDYVKPLLQSWKAPAVNEPFALEGWRRLDRGELGAALAGNSLRGEGAELAAVIYFEDQGVATGRFTLPAGSTLRADGNWEIRTDGSLCQRWQAASLDSACHEVFVRNGEFILLDAAGASWLRGRVEPGRSGSL